MLANSRYFAYLYYSVCTTNYLNTFTFQVKRVLPRWLTTPKIISVNLQKLETKVSDLKQLDKSIRRLLIANGVMSFFPVQAEVIPWLIESNRYVQTKCFSQKSLAIFKIPP